MKAYRYNTDNTCTYEVPSSASFPPRPTNKRPLSIHILTVDLRDHCGAVLYLNVMGNVWANLAPLEAKPGLNSCFGALGEPEQRLVVTPRAHIWGPGKLDLGETRLEGGFVRNSSRVSFAS